MTFKGTVQRGSIVIDSDTRLPEGAEVRVELAPFGRSEDLLEEASFDDAVEKLRFLYKVREGLRQAEADETVSHEEARVELAEWLD